MKRAIYLLMITVITIACVIIGTIHHIGGGNGISIGSGDVVSDQCTLIAFDSINVEADVMELTVKYGKDYAISYSCTESLVPEYEVEDGGLVITQKKTGLSLGNTKCQVTVTIPEEKELQSVYMYVDVGDVTMEDIDTVMLTAELDVGDLNIRNVQSETVTITCDTGDIDIENAEFVHLDICADVGDINVQSAKNLDGYSFDMKCDLGDINVNGEGCGNEHNQGGSEGSVSVQSDVGDVEVRY